jgi:hypothetical protein
VELPAYLLGIVVVAVAAYSLWRNRGRRGRSLPGAEAGPALEAALRQLLERGGGFVVLSAGDTLYLQFACQGSGLLAEANVPDGDPRLVAVLADAGFSAVNGRPNYRATIPSPSADSLVDLSRRFFDSAGTSSVQIRSGR